MQNLNDHLFRTKQAMLAKKKNLKSSLSLKIFDS